MKLGLMPTFTIYIQQNINESHIFNNFETHNSYININSYDTI